LKFHFNDCTLDYLNHSSFDLGVHAISLLLRTGRVSQVASERSRDGGHFTEEAAGTIRKGSARSRCYRVAGNSSAARTAKRGSCSIADASGAVT
jgi:hypothetical protein